MESFEHNSRGKTVHQLIRVINYDRKPSWTHSCCSKSGLEDRACLLGLQMVRDAHPTGGGNSPGSLQQPGATTEQGRREAPACPSTCPHALLLSSPRTLGQSRGRQETCTAYYMTSICQPHAHKSASWYRGIEMNSAVKQIGAPESPSRGCNIHYTTG